MVGRYTIDSDGDVCCAHGKARLLVSKTGKNPNRKFYKCLKDEYSCLFKFADEIPGPSILPQSQTDPSSPSKSNKRSRDDESMSPEAKRRRLEIINSALESNKQSQSQLYSQDSQVGYIQEAQLPSQDLSEERREAEDDDLFGGGQPSTPQKQPYRLSNVNIKYEEPESSTLLSTSQRHRQRQSQSQDDVDAEELVTPVRDRISMLTRKCRALEQSNDANKAHINTLTERVRVLEVENERVKNENQNLRNDLDIEKKNVVMYQRFLEKK